jgi:uncharacterized protein (TIGR02599 family)
MVLIVIGGTITMMQNTWVKVRDKADLYRSARSAMETMARRLAQATLSVHQEAGTMPADEGNIIRRSDLHFVSGQGRDLVPNGSDIVGHAVFFHAPMGYDLPPNPTGGAERHDQLTHLLNACGFFVSYGSDDRGTPSFIRQQGNVPPRRRFRLMELKQPTDRFDVFTAGQQMDDHPTINTASAAGDARRWITEAMAEPNRPRNVSVLAENVLGFVIRPISGGPLSPGAFDATKHDLAPDLEYDSRRFQWETGSVLGHRTRHRLPPALELTLIVVADSAWDRLGPGQGEAVANQLQAAINNRFRSAAAYSSDITSLDNELSNLGLDHRIMTTKIAIPEGTRDRLP